MRMQLVREPVLVKLRPEVGYLQSAALLHLDWRTVVLARVRTSGVVTAGVGRLLLRVRRVGMRVGSVIRTCHVSVGILLHCVVHILVGVVVIVVIGVVTVVAVWRNGARVACAVRAGVGSHAL